MRRDLAECLYPTALGPRASARARALASCDPEPIIAVLEPLVTDARRLRLCAVVAARLEAVTLVLDAPHDPHNGAAVVRSADAFGLARVHVLERKERFAAARAVSRGAERWVEIVPWARADELAGALAASGHRLVATHPDGELEVRDLAALGRVALVLGNEHAGIGDDLRGACGASVRVPMRGFVESLNLSVTAAVLLSHATAGRVGDLAPHERRRLSARFLVTSVGRSDAILAERGIALDAGPAAEGADPASGAAAPHLAAEGGGGLDGRDETP
ncbi:MAG: RNA methyltransferase [Myxococcales bacterium]|nr:RNA methyltransferase [Myxococcales bacterium]